MREGVAIGVIWIRRAEVRPFSEEQVTLLQTFADQAVIAIENVRLFTELEARNRELTEALEQQTATAEVLEVISRSPATSSRSWRSIVESAARLCGADEASSFSGATAEAYCGGRRPRPDSQSGLGVPDPAAVRGTVGGRSF